MIKINLSKEEQDQILADDSQTLATRIVIHRMLNSFHEEAKLAMFELMRRRVQDKEEFDFEKYIEDGFKENNIDIKIPSLNELKKSIIEKNIYSIFRGESSKEKDDEPENEDEIKLNVKQEKDLNEILEVLGEILSG